jgi:chromosome segregation ATPase
VVSLEQVRTLEDRVEKAVARIASLGGEVVELRRRLAEAQSFIDDAANELAEAEEKYQAAEKRAEAAEARRVADAELVRETESRLSDMALRVAAAETKAAELSARAEEYRKDQAKIEEGIIHALEKLDTFEDLVLAQAGPSAEKAAPQARKPAPPAEKPAPQVEKPAVAAESSPRDSGIAVKAGPDIELEDKGGSAGVEPLENELDIF